MENLTLTDIDILIEALTTWETKDWGSDVLMDLVGSMIFPKGSKGEAEEKQRQEEMKVKSAIDKKGRQEASILLKAKLIQLKGSLEVEFLGELKNA